MQEKWAALLANAAAGALGAEVLPSFVEILSSLSPAEAFLLDVLSRLWADDKREPQLETLLIKSGISQPDAYRKDSPTRIRALVMVENLARFGLCVVRTPDQALNRLRQQIEENPTFLERYTHVGVTNLGEAFVAACSAPAGAQTGAQASDPA